MTKPEKVIFAPHCDDAFFALGGAICAWRERGEQVLILDCFSRSGLTRQASSTNRKSMIDLISHTRALEDLVNALRLGAKVEFLGLPEVLLRGYSDIFGNRKRFLGIPMGKIDDSWIPAHLEKTFSRYTASSECYFPLGIGDHVDHVLVSQVGRKMTRPLQRSNRIFFYEDIPYVTDNNSSSVLQKDLDPINLPIDWGKKEALLRTYKSQLAGRYAKTMISSVRSYHESLGGCERVWQPTSQI